jgi:hypothetical protein
MLGKLLQRNFVNEKYEKPRSRYPAKSVNEQTLTKFVLDKSLPLVGHKSKQASAGSYEATVVPEVTVFAKFNEDLATEKHLKDFNYFANRIRKFIHGNTQEYGPSKFVFNIAHRDTYKSDLKSAYGIKKQNAVHNYDVYVGLRADDVYYAMESTADHKFSVDAIKQFLDEYLRGKLVGKAKVPPVLANNTFCTSLLSLDIA